MENQIPEIVGSLYDYLVTEPNPKFWPSYIAGDPVRAHGLWSFYCGLQAGMQIAAACLEKG